MTITEVRQRLQEIEANAWDFEHAHSLEDQLYRDFVAWVAQVSGGNMDPGYVSDVACEVLKTREIAFARYTA